MLFLKQRTFVDTAASKQKEILDILSSWPRTSFCLHWKGQEFCHWFQGR